MDPVRELMGHTLGLFIIDPKGIVRQITINDLPIGRSVDETVRLIKALQFVEKHGEVCPANWQPDSPTIVPDPQKSKKYFEKVKSDNTAALVPPLPSRTFPVILGRSVAVWQPFAMELPLSSPAKCELRSVIRFLNAKNNSPVEIHRQLVEVYGEKCMDIKNVRK
ncbi:TPX1 [Cordylochernes scorpioides]|nr:TPX1 [Cordylochernes scorpioides]